MALPQLALMVRQEVAALAAQERQIASQERQLLTLVAVAVVLTMSEVLAVLAEVALAEQAIRQVHQAAPIRAAVAVALPHIPPAHTTAAQVAAAS